MTAVVQQPDPHARFVSDLHCGHQARTRGRPRAGQWVTCQGDCQGQRRVDAVAAVVNVLSLFSGIGGLDLGLERAGMTVVGQVEIDPWCRRVLAKHWPEVPRHDDVRTAARWWGGRPAPDVVAGGFPCQPVSLAGRRHAQDDPRWLWPAMAAVIRDLRPRFVLVENVIGLSTAGLGDVLGDLAALGFDAEWGVLSACAMGAPHPRERLFIVGNATSGRFVDTDHDQREHFAPRRPEWLAAHPQRGAGEATWWTAEPGLDRVDDGLPAPVDRLRGLGNAVVPQVAQHIGEMIMRADGGSREAV